MAKLALVVLTAFLMYTVASQPLDVNVEVTVNGVKIPIGQDDQPVKLRARAAAKTLDNSNEIIPDYLIRRGK